ncbi:MAG: hypothetical protein Kow00127_05280 [Bacteroidales bacterium]
MKLTALRYLLPVATLLSLNLSGQNNALDFAEKDRVNVPVYTMSGFSGLTVEAWIKLDKYLSRTSFNATGSPAIFQKTDSAITSYNDYGIILMVLCLNHYQGHDKQLAFGLNFGSAGNIHVGLHSGDTVRLNEWHHIAGTWDGNTMKVYIDGVLKNTADVSDPQYSQLYSPDNGLYLGYRDEGQYGYLDGQLDEVRIWSVAHSETEIRNNMYRELSGNETGLYAYWNLNEGSGEDVYDQTSSGFDGYLGSTYGPGLDVREPVWVTSTAPVPYYTKTSGDWATNSTWATGQLTPQNSWSRVRIDHTVTVGSNVATQYLEISPSGALTVNSGSTLSISDTLFITSDATGTGSLIDNGSISYTTAWVEQYFESEKWHYFSPSVANVPASDFMNLYLMDWDEPTEAWGYITSPSQVLNTMQGYAVWASDALTGSTTVDFTGTLNTGSYSIAVTNTPGTSAPPGEDPSGYNFTGNPYPSSVDWDATGWTRTNVDNAIYIITYPGGARQYGSYVNGISTNGVTNILGPHQGFFVKCNSSSGGTLAVNNSARTHSSAAMLKGTEEKAFIKLMVTAPDDYSDEAVLNVNESASWSFDSQYDAFKLKGSSLAPQLYLTDGVNNFSINSVNEIDQNSVVPLLFEAGSDGIHELRAQITKEFPFQKFWIEDLQTGESITVPDELPYKFGASVGDASQRFLLRFGNDDIYPATGDKSMVTGLMTNQGSVKISLSNTTGGEASLYALDGRYLSGVRFGAGQVTLETGGYTGIAILKIRSGRNVEIRRLYIAR